MFEGALVTSELIKPDTSCMCGLQGYGEVACIGEQTEDIGEQADDIGDW